LWAKNDDDDDEGDEGRAGRPVHRVAACCWPGAQNEKEGDEKEQPIRARCEREVGEVPASTPNPNRRRARYRGTKLRGEVAAPSSTAQVWTRVPTGASGLAPGEGYANTGKS